MNSVGTVAMDETVPLLIEDDLLSKNTLSRLGDLPGSFNFCHLQVEERDREVLVLNHPDLVRTVLVRNHRKFQKGPEFARIKMLTGAGMIVTDGARWRASRCVVQPAFVKANQHLFMDAVDAEAQALLDRWTVLARENTVVDVITEAERIALNVMMRAIFSEDASDFATDDGGWLFDILKSDCAKSLQVAAKVHAARRKVTEVVSRRRSKAAVADILGLLIESRDALCPELSDADLVDEIVTLIVAGFETSSIVLGWFWYFLAKSQECRDFLAEAKEDLDQRIASMANECLRLYPPVWMFSRRAVEDVDLSGIHVPKRSVVAVSPYFLHRRPDIWADPGRFDPARFMAFGPRDPRWQAFIPFSAGPRRCIGDVHSEYEVKSVMSRVVGSIELSLLPGQEIKLSPLINLRSRDPINVQLSLI